MSVKRYYRSERRRARKSRRRPSRDVRMEANGVYVITDKDLARIYASPCAECGTTERIEADHVIPISRGGQHSIGNLQPLCKSCNSSKCDRLNVEWKYPRQLTLPLDVTSAH